MKKIISILSGLLMTLHLMAQQSPVSNPNEEVEMAGLLYQNGKIYVVVFVLATIFAGIIFYLIRLELKLNKVSKKS